MYFGLILCRNNKNATRTKSIYSLTCLVNSNSVAICHSPKRTCHFYPEDIRKSL